MAPRFVSPSVVVTENDLSFLPTGIAQIGAAFVGPTTKGPAFVPTIVESQDDFIRRFGTPIPEFYVGNAVQEYLKDAARATVVRVLGLDGFDPAESRAAILIATSASVATVAGVLFPASNKDGVTPVSISAALFGARSGSGEFNLSITSSDGTMTRLLSSSVVSTNGNYFVHALGESPSSPAAAYVSLNFSENLTANYTMSVVNTAGADAALNFSGSTYGVYDHASTPWIRSQTVGGTRHDLFKVHAFSDGNASNNDIKVSIASVKPAGASLDDQHGSFALLVRAISDTDSRINVLEQFDNLSLDPDSPNFIARRIGDQRWVVDADGNITVDGEFKNLSHYIWVEVVDGVENLPERALPVGFDPLRAPIATTASVPEASFVETRYEIPFGSSESVENVRRYYGYDYGSTVNLAYLNPLPSGAALIGDEFSLEDVTDGDVTASIVSGTVLGSAARKFTVPLQGGFDGLNPARVLAVGADIEDENTQGFNLKLSTSPGAKAFQQAIEIISNDEAFDINLLVLPGVLRSLHPFVTQLAIDTCEERGDCFYIMDAASLDDSVDTVVSTVEGIDSNYVGCYHPWVKILDVASNKLIWVPASVVMPGVYAFNDRVAAEWFAPAGLNRGGIGAAVQVRRRLTKSDRDTLYDGRVNPIALFPGQGIAAFGQKTLQVKSSALDRINVRRLMIAVKKFIASSARFLVFEQNVASTRQRFLNIVNPYLASVQERSGLYAFRVIMDATNNGPDTIDRNILVGQILLAPTRTAEYISLEFSVTATGASFAQGA